MVSEEELVPFLVVSAVEVRAPLNAPGTDDWDGDSGLWSSEGAEVPSGNELEDAVDGDDGCR